MKAKTKARTRRSVGASINTTKKTSLKALRNNSGKSKKSATTTKYKYSSVKDMFRTMKRKQQRQTNKKENETTATNTQSTNPISPTPGPASNTLVLPPPVFLALPQPSQSTTSQQSTPRIAIRRNLFGIRLNHDQLNRDLKQIWQEQIEKQKVQWNFDFEKLQPVGSEEEEATERCSAKIITRTRTRTRSSSTGEKLTAGEQNASSSNESGADTSIVDKRYQWKRVSTQLSTPGRPTSINRLKNPTEAPVRRKQPSSPMTPTPMTPTHSSNLLRNLTRINSSSSFGMAISALEPKEVDSEFPHEYNNHESSIYVYDEGESGEEDEEEYDEALAVPRFYKYQRIFKLNEIKRRNSSLPTSSMVLYQHKATNTSPSSSTTSNSTAVKLEPIFNKTTANRNESKQIRNAKIAASIGSVLNRNQQKQVRGKVLKSKLSRNKSTSSSAIRNLKAPSQGLIITFSENRKDTLRSAHNSSSPADENSDLTSNAILASQHKTTNVGGFGKQLKQQSILGNIFVYLFFNSNDFIFLIL